MLVGVKWRTPCWLPHCRAVLPDYFPFVRTMLVYVLSPLVDGDYDEMINKISVEGMTKNRQQTNIAEDHRIR